MNNQERSQNVSKYFGKTISGFVSNKFIVTMSHFALGNDLKFYAKKVSIPYETLNFVEDIYTSDVTLARPKNVLSVNTTREISITFRMDPENSIISSVEALFNTTHKNDNLEATRTSTEITLKVDVYGPGSEPKYSKSFTGCRVVSMNSYDADMADKKLKEYEVTLQYNMNGAFAGNTKSGNYSNNKSSMEIAVSCNSIYKDYLTAFQKYDAFFNSQDKGLTSTQITSNAIDKALSDSNIIPAYQALLANKSKCTFPAPKKFKVGSDIPLEARKHLLSRLNSAGIGNDLIDTTSFGN